MPKGLKGNGFLQSERKTQYCCIWVVSLHLYFFMSFLYFPLKSKPCDALRSCFFFSNKVTQAVFEQRVRRGRRSGIYQKNLKRYKRLTGSHFEPAEVFYLVYFVCLASSLQGSFCCVQVRIGLTDASVYLVFLSFKKKKKF